MKRMKLAACFVLALGLAACQGGNPFSESKRTHTPVYVYRNPIKPVMDDQLPQFANYPDGRTKLGLLGPVQSVTCMGFPIIDISFNEQGNITYTCSSLDEARRFSERNTFVYDESGRLQDIRDEAGSTHPAFVYDADGRLISEGQGRYKSDYTYHANGKLRKARGHEFDEEGRLVRRSGYTQNIYVCDAKNDYNTLRSESTFSYTDGLCTLQEETLYYHYYDVEKRFPAGTNMLTTAGATSSSGIIPVRYMPARTLKTHSLPEATRCDLITSMTTKAIGRRCACICQPISVPCAGFNNRTPSTIS